MSHLQPPEPQPAVNSARPTGRTREGQPSGPLQQNTSQPLYPPYSQYEPQPQYPQSYQYPQEPQPSPNPLDPQPPQYPQYLQRQQSTRITQNPQLLPENPQQPLSTRITQNPQQLPYPAPYPAPAPAPYRKPTPTDPSYQKQQLESDPGTSAWRRYSDRFFPRRDYSRAIIVTLVSGVLALLLIGVLTVASAYGNSTAGTGSQSKHNTGNTGAQATATLPHSGGQGAQPIFAPLLGGTVSDFAVQYGIAENPTNNEAGLWQHVTIAGQPVALSVSTAPSQDSRDGDLHVMNVIVQTTSSSTWNATTQQHIIAALLPPDAKLVRQVATGNGNEIIYTSAQLAATFQDGLFTNDAGKTVAPGTFNEQCFLVGTAVQAGGAATTCWLTVGEI